MNTVLYVCSMCTLSSLEAPIDAKQSSALSRCLGGPKAQLFFFSTPITKTHIHTHPSLPLRSCGDSPLCGCDAAVGRGGFVTQRDRRSTNCWPTNYSYYPAKVFRSGSLNWIYMCVLTAGFLGTGNDMDWGLGHWSPFGRGGEKTWGELRWTEEVSALMPEASLS